MGWLFMSMWRERMMRGQGGKGGGDPKQNKTKKLKKIFKILKIGKNSVIVMYIPDTLEDSS
jgi:hypothetical protein